MPRLLIDIEGSNADDAYALAVFLAEKTGCAAKLETDYRETAALLHRRPGRTLPHLRASSSQHLESIILTYTAAQICPGVQEFTKTIGKKAGHAVGELITEWLKAMAPKTGKASFFTISSGEKGVLVTTVES